MNGGRGIRTPGTVPRTAVFKTAGINHSPIPPTSSLPLWAGKFQILDAEMLASIRNIIAEAKGRGDGIRVFDPDGPDVRVAVHSDVIRARPFDLEPLAVL